MTVLQAQDSQAVINDIAAHIRKQGDHQSFWYVGITENINQRVFGDHRVPKEGHWRIHRKTISSNVARNAEKALLNWGCDGGTGGGDNDAVFVYAYLKTTFTNP